MPTDYTVRDIRFMAEGILSAPIGATLTKDAVATELSGIALNQNADLTGSVEMDTDYIWQTFRFPANYPLGISGGANIAIPKLCGFQINASITLNHGPAAGLDWAIDYWHPERGWLGVAKGTEVGSSGDGESAWFSVNFEPMDITNFWWRKFRLGVAGRDGDPTIFRVPIEYNGSQVTINDQIIDVIPNINPAPLVDGGRYIFQLEGGKPALLEYIGGDVYYSEQHGVESVFYTAPNPYQGTNSVEYVSINESANDAANLEFEKIQDGIPFATRHIHNPQEVAVIPRIVGSDIKAYKKDGVEPILDTGREVSLRFRIMSTAPDTDRDCTGSLYRTVAVVSDPESVRTSVGDLQDAYWLSAPNPSQFACEALYLDIRDSNDAQVVDHIIIDPVTPGIYMNIYYSNDDVPGDDTNSWDGLLWHRVDKQFLLRRKETFALPEPITARYIKLEFTHLQPVWYAPGTFQLPTPYRKHPKWVMDYYLSYYQSLRAQDLEQASKVNVTYDALDLAYNYFLDDIRQEVPLAPTTISSSVGVSLLSNVLSKAQSTEMSKVDANTLLQISTSLQPFTSQPSQQGGFGSLLQRIIGPTVQHNNYPIENTVTPLSSLGQVSSLDRDSLIIEKQFPVTSFYLTCRHYYMTSQATFQEDRAYFAGIKEVTLTREHYATRYDNELYIETAGDNLNIESNDFESVDHTWVTYSTTS